MAAISSVKRMKQNESRNMWLMSHVTRNQPSVSDDDGLTHIGVITMKNSIRFERLANGYYRAFDYGSKLSGLYNADGSYHSGDLRLTKSFVTSQINGGK
jgi:hypothetical protein